MAILMVKLRRLAKMTKGWYGIKLPYETPMIFSLRNLKNSKRCLLIIGQQVVKLLMTGKKYLDQMNWYRGRLFTGSSGICDVCIVK